MRQGTRFRGLFISIAVLALSAGAVFAGQALPTAAQPGLERAAERSGVAVPVGRQTAEEPVVVEAPDGTTDVGDEEEVAAPDDALEAVEAWDNHGAMVSEAAHMIEPAGFRNHGHFVSCVAHMDHAALDDEGQPVDLAALTPEDCDAAVEDEVDEAVDEAVDESDDVTEAEWDNHGAMVSEAAHMADPDGFRNHGHFVSCVARIKDLATAPTDLAALVPEDCDEAPAADADAATVETSDAEGGSDKASNDKGKGHGKDKAANGGKGKGHGKGKGRGK